MSEFYRRMGMFFATFSGLFAWTFEVTGDGVWLAASVTLALAAVGCWLEGQT